MDLDPEEKEAFDRITSNWLTNKFKNCFGDDCRMFCDEAEARALMKSLLPPLTPAQIDDEVNKVLSSVDDKNMIDLDEFSKAFSANTYWTKAGPLVVQELVFLDCLNTYYFEKRNMLENDDYEELKEMLTWQGSSVVTLTGEEARFISAVAASNRGP